MMKRLIAVPFILSMGLSAAAPPPAAQAQQDEGVLEGIVRSAEGGMPLAGATITVVGTGRGAVTHGDGAFRIAVPDAEQYQLRVDRLGYATTTLDVGHGESATVDLEVAAVPSPDLVVTAVLSPTVANEAIRPSAVFAGEELQRQLAGTVAKTVSTVPGVAVNSMGPGTAQPVIRGLTGDRILVLEDHRRVGDVINSGLDHASALSPPRLGEST